MDMLHRVLTHPLQAYETNGDYDSLFQNMILENPTIEKHDNQPDTSHTIYIIPL